MKNWLTEAYPSPLNNSLSKSLKVSIAISCFIVLFLLFFRPFDLPTTYDEALLLAILGYGVITFIIDIIFMYFIPKSFASYLSDRNWVLWKEILYVAALILSIAIGNLLYSSMMFTNFPLDFKTVSYLIAGTFAIGIIPASFIILIDLLRSQTKFQAVSEKLTPIPAIATPTIDETIQFESEYDDPPVICNISDFLFAEAQSNYVTFHIKEANLVKKYMLRSSLKKVSMTIQGTKGIMKVHRSYLVNLNTVIDFSGNAQGFELSFRNTEAKAKVSRTFTKEVKAFFNKV
ncbi:LytTR family transcriptional regulator [Saprospiraceae bacterium]|nr:LytTR family transcriptional regulator [Saprospiraceae bacterium]